MWYTKPTITLPPTRLPKITGIKLPTKPSSVTESATSTVPESLSSMASGMKYILAILCSKPAATNAEIGNTIATALSITLRPANAIQTAMHTSTLHNKPRKKAVQNGNSHFAAAILAYMAAMAPSFMVVWPERNTRTANPTAPTKLAAHTTPQFINNSDVVILLSAQAIAKRLLPVNSSAPATMTSNSPREKVTPPSTCCMANPSSASDFTKVKYKPPRPIKAPANMPSITMESSGSLAFTTPMLSTFSAICLGENASNPKISAIRLFPFPIIHTHNLDQFA
ncbi:hypothetical protein H744_1c0418 [Photobacterium gaetbulicola Gung47]|uniref:Uncharacterized protein n=1 Tax=Photobacterium gaetbulicola Gung47 TaxID=658445 RepID=A0A0C5WEB9_9GAMM|nr:hypothetical protein H744_1c0418 [Photobacterium gaetbulicola Gung47]